MSDLTSVTDDTLLAELALRIDNGLLYRRKDELSELASRIGVLIQDDDKEWIAEQQKTLTKGA